MAILNDPYGEFCGQHSAQLLDNGHLLLYDNGVHCVVDLATGLSRRETGVFSRAVEYAIDPDNREAIFQRHHSLHGDFNRVGWSAGLVQPMDNGDWLVSWGRGVVDDDPDTALHPDESVTQVDPDNGTEKFSINVQLDHRGEVSIQVRAYPLSPVALAAEPAALTAELPASSHTSVFHLGATDSPQVVVSFSRPIVDFDETTPSFSVTGATVASVSAHVVAGEPAHAYLVTLTPDGDGAITFRLLTYQACAVGGICTADGTTLSEAPSGPVTISAPPTVGFGAATYEVDEGGTVDVSVELSAAHQGLRDITIPVVVAAGTTAGSDEYSEPPSLTFAAGESTKTFTFAVHQDADDDDDEFVKLAFGALPDGVSAATNAETTVNIKDDDDPHVVIRFDSDSYSVVEGGSVEVSLSLRPDPERSVTIPLKAPDEGGASTGDYGAPSSVTFNSGETTKAITFTATDDNIDDDDESVTLEFGELPHRVEKGDPGETKTTIAILDNDVPRVSVMFVQANYTVAEGSPEDIRVELTADPERTVEIPLNRVELGGATDADYSGVPASVTFNSGETKQAIPFFAIDDGENDDGEAVRLSFGALPDDVTARGITRTDIGITDDDLPDVAVSFDEDDYNVAEGDSVFVTLTLNADPERTVTIPIVVTERGGADEREGDYSLSADHVTFESGETTMRLTLSAGDDRDDDNDESVRLTFGALPTGVTAGDERATTVAIMDNDVTVRYGAGTYFATEGSEVDVQVWLNEAPDRPVTIPIRAVNQGGADGNDYSGVPAELTFESTDTLKSFTVVANDDTEDDDNESVRLTFGPLPATVSAGDPAEATIEIGDDDDPVVKVSFLQGEYTVAEGSPETVTVQLSANPERSVEVLLTATAQDGASTLDYDAVPASVTFQSGQTDQTFTFNAIADDEFDANESVLIGLGALPERVQAGDPDETTVKITDDDLPEVKVSFGATTYTASEGSRLTIPLSLTDDPQRTLTITLTLTNENGAMDSDYILEPRNVIFTAGETMKTITFTANPDAEDDGGEYVTLGFFSTLPTGVTPGEIAEAEVTIRERPQNTGLGGGGGGGGGPSGPSPSKLDFEWTVTRDIEALDSTQDSPTGSWSDGTTVWIAENGDDADDALYAYDVETGDRVKDREFDLDESNRAPRGLWSNGTTLWIADSGQDRLFAYDLESGERDEEQEVELDTRNRDPRGIWSDGTTVWVLDGRADALFAYDLKSGELIAEHALDSANDDPRGIWSDGVTWWVSDHGAKRLFAYRLPAPESPAVGDVLPLERVRDEEFANLSSASNNSPRGIWSDGEVMYVADESDGRVYSYNLPDAIDARLASLTLSGVEFGEFDPGVTEYEGVAGDGVTETTAEAGAVQRRTDVAIHPPDDDDDDANGHQVLLQGASEITVTVTSQDGTRRKVYRVAIQRPEVALELAPTWTSIEWPGADGVTIADVLRDGGVADEVLVVYQWDEVTERWKGFFPGLEDVPGLNTLATLQQGSTYWVAVTEPLTWTLEPPAPLSVEAD